MFCLIWTIPTPGWSLPIVWSVSYPRGSQKVRKCRAAAWLCSSLLSYCIFTPAVICTCWTKIYQDMPQRLGKPGQHPSHRDQGSLACGCMARGWLLLYMGSSLTSLEPGSGGNILAGVVASIDTRIPGFSSESLT